MTFFRLDKSKKANGWNICYILLISLIAFLGVYLCTSVSKFEQAEQSTDTFEIWTYNTMDVIKKKENLTYDSIPIGQHEIVQSFKAVNDRMEKLILRFEGFAPDDTASLIVTLTDKKGEEYYRYECPTYAFGSEQYFYLIGTPEKPLKKNHIYEIHVTLDSKGSNLAVCATSKKGTHNSAKTLTVDDRVLDDQVLYFCHTYFSDYHYAVPWLILILSTLLIMGIIAFVPSKIPAVIWNYGGFLALTAVAYYLFQALDKDGLDTIETKYIRLNVLLILSVLMLIKGTLPWISFYVSDALVIIWALTNYYVIQFKGEEFLLTQLSAFSTTMSVAGNYQYEISPKVLSCIAAGVCLLAIQIISDLRRTEFYRKKKKIEKNEKTATETVEKTTTENTEKTGIVTGILKNKKVMKFMNRVAVHVLFCLLGFLLFMRVYKNPLSHIPMFSLNDNISKEGYCLSNMCVLRSFRVQKPEAYSKAELNRIVEEIQEPGMNPGTVRPKNLIVIMNESFSDLEVVAPLQTNKDYIPFIRSMQENTIKGKSFVNVFGGSTSVTEYEFLTGNTAAFLPIGANPYVGFCKNTEPGIVRTLKSQGYYAVAMHPYGAKNWNRDKVYPAIGFDEFLDENDYKGYDKLRNFVSDKGDFQKIIEYTDDFDRKHANDEEGLFIFNVTMQNHGGYDDVNGIIEKEITIDGMEYDELAENYLTLIKNSDEAFEYLISHFSEVSEPTMIVMFGDHLPQLSNEFMDEMYGGDVNSARAEEKNHMYTTQYIIWTNYDIEPLQADEISVNYLGSYVLRLAGLKLTEYDKFLLGLRDKIPAIGKYGVRMADGSFVKYSDLKDSNIDEYKMLEYMRISDRKQGMYTIFELNEQEADNK